MSFQIANLEKMSMPMSYDNKKTAAKLAAVFCYRGMEAIASIQV